MSLKTLIKTAFLCVIAGFMCLVLWITLLPQLVVCGETGLQCIAVILIIVYLALICPLMLAWCARGYIVLKVMYEPFKLFEKLLVAFCTDKICVHRKSILAAGKIDASQWEQKIPSVLRAIINRLELKGLKPLLEKEDLKAEDLLQPLERRLEAQVPLQKPSFAWYWFIIISMYGSVVAVWFVF